MGWGKERGRIEERRIAEGGGGDFTSDPRRLVNVTKERRIVGRRRGKKRGGREIYRAEDGDEGEKIYTRNYYTLGDRFYFPTLHYLPLFHANFFFHRWMMVRGHVARRRKESGKFYFRSENAARSRTKIVYYSSLEDFAEGRGKSLKNHPRLRVSPKLSYSPEERKRIMESFLFSPPVIKNDNAECTRAVIAPDIFVPLAKTPPRATKIQGLNDLSNG